MAAPSSILSFLFQIRSVTILVWTGANRSFSIDSFFLKTGESKIDPQRVFRACFISHQKYAVLDRKSILL